jgi:hypothetical protein
LDRKKAGLLRRFAPRKDVEALRVIFGDTALSRKPAKTTSVSVKHATLDLLRAFGIKKVFGNPGSTELPFCIQAPASAMRSATFLLLTATRRRW